MTIPLPDTEPAPAARLLFTPEGTLALGHQPAKPEPLVVDSWLLTGGAVLGLELHESRFCASCAKLLPQLGLRPLRSFLSQVRAALPPRGLWFARIEAYAGPTPQLALWLRDPPPLERQTSLWVAPRPDPRAHPQVKGPDLPLLAELREEARLAGSDDALLCTADGTALEAAHAALVWWREETLCLPADDRLVLPSVTRDLLVQIARRRGVPIIRERIRPRDLLALESWTLNSLHGIRPVWSWRDADLSHDAPVSSARVAEWSAALAGQAAPVDDSPMQR